MHQVLSFFLSLLLSFGSFLFGSHSARSIQRAWKAANKCWKCKLCRRYDVINWLTMRSEMRVDEMQIRKKKQKNSIRASGTNMKTCSSIQHPAIERKAPHTISLHFHISKHLLIWGLRVRFTISSHPLQLRLPMPLPLPVQLQLQLRLKLRLPV